jgi:VanZ family protein
MIKIQWPWLAIALIFFLFMIIVGSLPGNAQALTEKINDKILHFLAYSLLTVLIYLSLSTTHLRKFTFTLSIIAILAMTDELIQSTMTFRNASLYDLSVDILAASLIASCLSLLPINNRKNKNS